MNLNLRINCLKIEPFFGCLLVCDRRLGEGTRPPVFIVAAAGVVNRGKDYEDSC